jgi:ribose 1,5-bisphosphokinase PhnN
MKLSKHKIQPAICYSYPWQQIAVGEYFLVPAKILATLKTGANVVNSAMQQQMRTSKRRYKMHYVKGALRIERLPDEK